jgi:predicted RNase H-like HicB family nuclease
MSQFHYTVSLLQTEEGFSVWVPGLPGCASQGQTEAEALENIRDAISGYLEAVEEISAGTEQREVVLQW